ncbi:MAG: sigma-54-dependent Fis family transcriptional regulator [Acidobacteria bacterium]|nr:MAG: sigma-54-dependent Fis family transcriptional regulator [Acidobacteriota bacterium]
MNKRESVRTTADAAEREPVRSRSLDNEDGKTVARIVTEKIHRERYLAEYAPLFDGSASMRAVREMLENIADTDATVMLRGESGVGKDLVARAIHAASKRCNGAFIKVNCAAIPPGLLESELSGHEKGAFTGAHRRKPGQFEYANQGTIYLDEVADLPLSLQAKLLHVLQDLRFSRVGGHGTIDVDVRVVAATNRDLEQGLARGDFREDLYYRLNVVEIGIPPLRDRKEEILVLATRFLARFNQQYGRNRALSPEMTARLLEHSWRGNVRELENIIRRVVLLQDGEQAFASHVARRQQIGATVSRPTSHGEESLRDIARRGAQEAERKALAEVLDRVQWNRAEAARFLKVSYKTLLNKITECQLKPPSSSPRDEQTNGEHSRPQQRAS